MENGIQSLLRTYVYWGYPILIQWMQYVTTDVCKNMRSEVVQYINQAADPRRFLTLCNNIPPSQRWQPVLSCIKHTPESLHDIQNMVRLLVDSDSSGPRLRKYRLAERWTLLGYKRLLVILSKASRGISYWSSLSEITSLAHIAPGFAIPKVHPISSDDWCQGISSTNNERQIEFRSDQQKKS